MNIRLLLFVFLISTISIMTAHNHMDIMTTMTGEHSFAEIGWLMTTLDWNGDGNDDLIVNEVQWNPDGYPFTHNTSGKLLIYFGGPNFDNVPEIVIPGHHQIEFSHTSSMCNAGDMNGDGIDDLALFRATMYEDNNDQHYDLQLCVFYGGSVPDTIPDYVLTFPREEWDNTYCYVRELGDINGDGYDDLGYILESSLVNYKMGVSIVWGGNMLNSVFRVLNHVQRSADVIGVKDVNADGIDDFIIGNGYTLNDHPYTRITLYYGNTTGVVSDSLIITDGANIRSSFSYPVGDIDWDGYPDFASLFTGSDARLYFGGPQFDGSQFVAFSPP